MTVADDLATLRGLITDHSPDGYDQVDLGWTWGLRRNGLEALDRVEAEVARLEREKQVLVREAVRFTRGGDPDYSPDYQDEYQRLWHEAAARAEAAEAEIARLRDGLRRAKMRAIDAWNECGIAAPQDHFLRDIEAICDKALAEDGAA